MRYHWKKKVQWISLLRVKIIIYREIFPTTTPTLLCKEANNKTVNRLVHLCLTRISSRNVKRLIWLKWYPHLKRKVSSVNWIIQTLAVINKYPLIWLTDFLNIFMSHFMLESCYLECLLLGLIQSLTCNWYSLTYVMFLLLLIW